MPRTTRCSWASRPQKILLRTRSRAPCCKEARAPAALLGILMWGKKKSVVTLFITSNQAGVPIKHFSICWLQFKELTPHCVAVRWRLHQRTGEFRLIKRFTVDVSLHRCPTWCRQQPRTISLKRNWPSNYYSVHKQALTIGGPIFVGLWAFTSYFHQSCFRKWLFWSLCCT